VRRLDREVLGGFDPAGRSRLHAVVLGLARTGGAGRLAALFGTVEMMWDSRVDRSLFEGLPQCEVAVLMRLSVNFDPAAGDEEGAEQADDPLPCR